MITVLQIVYVHGGNYMMFICTDLNGNFYTCNCDAGFEPDDGDASAGNPNLCTPGGTCENLNGNFYTCNCDAGFEPDDGDASAGDIRLSRYKCMIAVLLIVYVHD